ncbi:site-specific integrase [Saccharopolyspora sp. K220]|uniref:tyrosine-type recombinase/integrase n=1 Tax=Saccharopolyspora soli TaxID=2926618 RepID=UPI001F591890|nr:site-specific integrase [Saccharopolyspora soli]MCI2422490.1 site-specific integrase [Saccharopolyspora soli]
MQQTPASPDFRGQVADELRHRFPPRPVPDAWPISMRGRADVLGRIEEMLADAATQLRVNWRRGADLLLQWLETFPGESWQQRWYASPAHDLGQCWADTAAQQLAKPIVTLPNVLRCGLLALFCLDAVRPRMTWLVECRSPYWTQAITTYRDPSGFAALEASVDPIQWSKRVTVIALNQLAKMLIAKGGGIRDITVGDCLEFRDARVATLANSAGQTLFYSLLRNLGSFPADAPVTLNRLGSRSGQLSVAQLVDRFGLACRPVRDLFVDYLTERQPVLDYKSVDSLSRNLAQNFWQDLERHHPGIDSLHLPPEIAASWKERLRTKTTRRRQPDGSIADVASPRKNYTALLTGVRGFYLDIAEWALEDPARWGPWAAPSPVSAAEVTGWHKAAAQRKARMDQRTRERLPIVPLLAEGAARRLQDARTRLEAVLAAAPGERFTVLGETFVRAGHAGRTAIDGSKCAYDDTGRRHNFEFAENRAFWAWASVEFLRHTGVRIEEMLEVSHHSITQYRLPATGELIPLLQIAPSKTDEERLLVVSPELADVLSAIVQRVRASNGAIPLVTAYDPLERVWNPPLPLLFQWQVGGERRAVSRAAVRKGINEVLLEIGLTDAAGEPLTYQLHDFRRIFATEAIQNGMPPHIAQLLLGHKDINTTMGYKAVYPQEAINGHRAFIARRRGLRPSFEYRTPTDEEWDEFLGHFQRRKLSLGECGRAYGSGCQHEHACVRCSLLRVDPAQRGRLEEIRDNLVDRVAEAEREGWVGEADGLRVSLAAAQDKLAQLNERALRATTINLGLPAFGDVAGRTTVAPRRLGDPANA